MINQAKRRDEAMWIDGLRGAERSSADPVLGLLHLNVSLNRLGDQFALEMVRALSFDQYLRVPPL